jgi:hypothetical protein
MVEHDDIVGALMLIECLPGNRDPSVGFPYILGEIWVDSHHVEEAPLA